MKKSHLIAFSTSFGLVVASILMTAFFWNELPAQIPTHFGFSGTPDAFAQKNIVFVFMIPAIQLLLTLFFILIYRHPQYSSWPTTLILMTVEKKHREKVFEVLRGMLAGIVFVLSLFFAYLQFIILATANQRVSGLSSYVMIGFMVFLFGYIIFTNVRMYRTVHAIVKKQ